MTYAQSRRLIYTARGPTPWVVRYLHRQRRDTEIIRQRLYK